MRGRTNWVILRLGDRLLHWEVGRLNRVIGRLNLLPVAPGESPAVRATVVSSSPVTRSRLMAILTRDNRHAALGHVEGGGDEIDQLPRCWKRGTIGGGQQLDENCTAAHVPSITERRARRITRTVRTAA